MLNSQGGVKNGPQKIFKWPKLSIQVKEHEKSQINENLNSLIIFDPSGASQFSMIFHASDPVILTLSWGGAILHHPI